MTEPSELIGCADVARQRDEAAIFKACLAERVNAACEEAGFPLPG